MEQPNEPTLQDRILAASSTGAGTYLIDDIYIAEDRQREDTPAVRAYIDEELAPSFIDNGIIQLPVLHFPDEPIHANGRYYKCELIAGWCRTQTCLSLGMDTIPYNDRRSLRPDQLAEIELEENFRRKDMTWQEKAKGISKIHGLKQARANADGEVWGQKQTGKLMKASHGHVNDCLKIAKHLNAGDADILGASNFSDALKILLGRKEDELIAQLAASSSGTSAPISTPTLGPIRGDSGISISSAATATTTPDSGFVGEVSLVKEMDIDLSGMLFNMDNRDWFDQREDNSIDMVYTDIPYGIDMDNLDYTADDLDRVAGAHDVEENIEQMRPFLQNSYRVLKDKKYLMFWYDLAHHEKLQTWAKEAGFSVQIPPIVWCKEHPCRNRAGNIWWTGATEYVMVCRKGTATLRSAQTRNWLCADGSAERKTQRNPFSKPFAISKQLIEPVTIPGDTILDCYAGEGSLIRCGINMGRQIIGVEKEKSHFDRMTEHVKKAYTSMTRGKASFS